MSTDVSPRTIDALIPIEQIWVIGRHRKDLGDIDSLAASIADVDLLNPVTITPDYRLIAGQRRVEACRRLGWESIPARVVASLDEAAAMLRAERDENLEREEMRPSEKASLGSALEEIEALSARERQLAGVARPEQPSSLQGGRLQREVTAIVGDTLGMSRSTYVELQFAHRVAHDPARDLDEQVLAADALRQVDAGSGIQPTIAKLRVRLNARRDAADAKARALAAPVEPDPFEAAKGIGPAKPKEQKPPETVWIPRRGDNTGAAAAQRRTLIRQYAAEGQSSGQIAGLIDTTETWVRRAARDEGIPIPADEVMNRTRRIDSNRVVRETAIALEGLALGAQLVNPDVLDPAELGGWASSMTDSIRTLNRLVKQLKEKTREA